MDSDEPTQATQNVLDPRRIGKQNSGFSDEDISDIICVLYPYSDAAYQEVKRLAEEDSPHIIGKDDADVVEPDYDLEDHASRFESHPAGRGNYAIILRLSAQVKNPAAGFAFGRNSARCDVVFANDPLRRVSNIHFRIYVNGYGNVMIEDQSTNGTFADQHLLTSRPADKTKPPVTKWVLSSGTNIKILLHDQNRDLAFRVRIPRRDDEYDRAYINKVEEYFERHGLEGAPQGAAPSIRAGPGGHVDLFKTAAQPQNKKPGFTSTETQSTRSPSARRATSSTIPREWTGSGKYNRIGTIGKGAFAVVYKVTSKYDGVPYAAKEIEKRRFIKNGVLDQKVENEMKIMQRVQHPNIVRYMETMEWEDRLLIIIMEYIPGGDLGKIISDGDPFPEDMAQVMSRQLLGALGYLHANNITHRDVKPDNILINSLEPLDVKLTDFGLSKMVDSEQTFLRTFCGTLLYCAPEVYTEYAEYDENGIRSRGNKNKRRIPGQRYNHAVDIWSLGGVMFYALTQSPPYPVKSGISYSELLHRVMTTRLNIIPLADNGVSSQGIDFLHQMLQRRPENRATVAELEVHPWLVGSDSTIQASQSYDEITDDEDMIIQPSQFRPREYEDDRVSESMDDDSEKENGTFRPGNQPRLFGEVGVSAIGSSGVIPDHLNLPVADTSMGVTEIMDSNLDEAYDSGGSSSLRGQNRRVYRENTISIAHNQSADQLQSLVHDVASQSLGGTESVIHNPIPSFYSTHSMDPNSSKRKPQSSLENSEEYDENTPPGRHVMKRLKSEGNIEELSDNILEEQQLIARVPQIRRLGSGRQVDKPVSKAIYWEQDTRTRHLNYPEMTQLQNDAFCQAAKDRGETFGPGKTPLWSVAMKYFPPTLRSRSRDGQTVAIVISPAGHESTPKAAENFAEIPSTAPMDVDALPDTLQADKQLVVPIQPDDQSKRAIAMIDSHPRSSIQGISFPITDSLVSFGRGPDNTRIFEPTTDGRVPKYAFKILLWKDGYDPAKDPAKDPGPPWLRKTADEQSYSFWMSSKATSGIRINGQELRSSDVKNPNGPSEQWTRIHDGDSLRIWGSLDAQLQTTLIFRCFWGASSKSRGEHADLELASPAVAQKLNGACYRTEKRIREVAEKRRIVDDLRAEDQERTRLVEQERERSRAFEQKRREAVEFVQARQSRRGSPASAPPTAHTSRLLTTQTSRLSPDKGVGGSTR